MHGSFDRNNSEITENNDAKEADKKTTICEFLRSNAQNIKCIITAIHRTFYHKRAVK
jgi:hypothetical protein